MRKPNTAIVEQIKDAARELLKGKEPSQIGMRDIAEKCGITAANIYHYYKDNELTKLTLEDLGIEED